MVYNSKYRKKGKKGVKRRPFKKRDPRYSMALGVSFPSKLYAKLNFARELAYVTLSAGQAFNMTILANGLSTYGNETYPPMGGAPNTVGINIVQQFTRLWNNLNVYAKVYSEALILDNKSIITILGDSAGNTNTDTSLQIVVTRWCYYNANTTVESINALSTSTLLQQRYAKRGMIATGAGMNKKKIYMYATSKNVLGFKDIQDDKGNYCVLNSELVANVGSTPLQNPDHQWFYHIRVQNLSESQGGFAISTYHTARVMFTCPNISIGSIATPTAQPPPIDS